MFPKHPTHHRSPRRAFTLIEAICAIVLLAVALPAMFWAVRDAAVRRADPALAIRARWLALEKLESIIADRHCTTRGYPYVTASNYPGEDSIAGFAGFSRSVAVAETGADLAGPGAGYKRVTVTVSYTNSRGQTSAFSLATVLTDY